jgi:hypothetical protein
LEKIIGLGRFGCSVAEQLTAYPEYRVYKIDSEIEERGSLSIGKHNDIKEYEEKIDTDEIEVYLRSIKNNDQVLLIAEGGDPVVGSCLKILEAIKHSRLSILYICPDREMISEAQKRDDKICFNILQEYARSGVFEKIVLVSKSAVENLIGDVPLDEYENSISYFISYIVAMTNYFLHTDTILESKIQPSSTARIITYGVSSLEEEMDSTKLLFPLNDVRDLHIFYGVPEKELSSDNSLVKKIKDHTRSHKSDENAISFSVHSTTLESLLIICCAFSSKIQPLCK